MNVIFQPINTKKRVMEPFGAKITQKNEQNEQNDENNKTVNSDIFECDCGKEYKPKPKFTRSVKVKPYCFFFWH